MLTPIIVSQQVIHRSPAGAEIIAVRLSPEAQGRLAAGPGAESRLNAPPPPESEAGLSEPL